MQLVIAILEQYFKNEWHLRKHKHIPRIFFKDFNLLQTVRTYTSFLTDEEIICDLANVTYLIYFIMLSIGSKYYMILERESIILYEKVYLLIEEAVNKKYCYAVLQMCHLVIKYWNVFHSRLLPWTEQKDSYKNPIRFQNQFIPFQVLPLMMFLEERFQFYWTFRDVDELRDCHIQQCFGKISHYTIRLAYSYINALVSSISCKYEIAMRSINHIIESCKYYEQEVAVIHFQTQLYVFHDIIAMAKQDNKRVEIVRSLPGFFLTVINCIKVLIETHDIRWGKCMESACVLNAVLDFLLLTSWPLKVSLNKLIQSLAIFLSIILLF